MKNIAIGIDLGTTNSCASYYYNGTLNTIINNEGGRVTPSFLYFPSKGKTIVGKHAKAMADINPERGIYEIKRLIGRKFDDPYVQKNLKYFLFNVINESNDPIITLDLKGETLKMNSLELCTAILKKLKKDIEDKFKEPVDKAVITVPAYFNVNQREATLEAAEKAGFIVLKLLNEPTAAALSYYYQQKCLLEHYSLVYDLGGGTFDVAVLKRKLNDIEIIAVDGDSHLGGQDFNNIILEHVCKQLKSKYGYDPNNDRRIMRQLRNKCEEAKEILSSADETVITLIKTVGDYDVLEVPLTRSKFETLTKFLFKKTIRIISNCLENCALSKNVIKEVILSGGSTRIPKLQDMLEDYFGEKSLNKFINPDECVAEGAAIQAAMLSHNPKQIVNKINVIDVIPLSLGTEVISDKMDFVIKRNTPIPVSKSVSYSTVYNNQSIITFQIYEGERLNAKINRYLGELTISDLTPAPPGQCSVILTMTVDQNGILKITAKEKCSNNVRNLKVAYTRGHRSDNEIKNALKDAEDHKKEDKVFETFASYKSYAIYYCEAVRYNLENKQLMQSYTEIYKIAEEFEIEAKGLQVEDIEKVKSLINEIRRQCDGLVQKYNFDYMPSLPIDLNLRLSYMSIA